MSPQILEHWLSALGEVYGNASSIHHDGQVAKQRLEQARREVAQFLNAGAKDIVFTAGGTEANNIAIFGAMRRNQRLSSHAITTRVEHPSVLNCFAQLEREGMDVTYLAVDRAGRVDPSEVAAALRAETALISIMHANNEIGVLQPIQEIAAIARRAGVLFHSDGVQAAGRIPTDVAALGADLYSISGHKFYAPKGIGALYVRPGVALRPLLFGGRHERERRPGTENVPGAIALGEAAKASRASLAFEGLRLASLRDRLERGILAAIPDAVVNGAGADRLPNTSNICFYGIEGEAMVISLDLKGFAVSSGSACSSGAVEPSHVLLALGLSREDARSSVRFSLGRFNDAEQVDALVGVVADSVAHLRRLSPAYTAHA